MLANSTQIATPAELMASLLPANLEKKCLVQLMQIDAASLAHFGANLPDLLAPLPARINEVIQRFILPRINEHHIQKAIHQHTFIYDKYNVSRHDSQLGQSLSAYLLLPKREKLLRNY